VQNLIVIEIELIFSERAVLVA